MVPCSGVPPDRRLLRAGDGSMGSGLRVLRDHQLVPVVPGDQRAGSDRESAQGEIFFLRAPYVCMCWGAGELGRWEVGKAGGRGRSTSTNKTEGRGLRAAVDCTRRRRRAILKRGRGKCVDSALPDLCTGGRESGLRANSRKARTTEERNVEKGGAGRKPRVFLSPEARRRFDRMRKRKQLFYPAAEMFAIYSG